MNPSRTSAWRASLAAGLAVGLALAAGCTTVSPARRPADKPLAEPIDSSAGDAPSAIGSAPSPIPKSASVPAKAPPPVDPKASVSQQRQERLRRVAEDFERRRDESQYQAALNRWREDDGKGCREQLELLLARNPNHHPAHLLLAELALEQGEPKVALEHARAVLGCEPDNARAHHLLALALDSLGESAAAVEHYERATTLAPGNEQYAFAYQAALGAAVLPAATRGEGNVVTTAYDAADSRKNTDSAAHAGSTLDADNFRPSDPAACAAAADRAARATAGDEETAVDRRLEDFDRRAAAEPENLEFVVVESVYALRHHRPNAAAQLATAALRRHPESALLYRLLGAARYQEGDFHAAQVALAQALSLDNTDALAYFLMGSTLARLGQADAARQHFAEVARLDPRIGVGRQ